MTSKEFQEVELGDILITKVSGVDREVRVIRRFTHGARITFVYVQRIGKDKRGREYPLLDRCNYELRKPDKPVELDPVPSNVFADWLEERGFLKASTALREAFPYVLE